MTRNTHDRALDHHGTDVATNIELENAVADYPAGTTVEAVIAALVSRITLLESRAAVYTFTISAEISS